jgi:sec-independent protein translocase protein TatC
MPSPRDEDLFRESTMTFGEHLEELRTCLFKAILGLVVGVLAGLWIGGDVVNFIQTPLERALTDYRQKQVYEKLKTEYDKARDQLQSSTRPEEAPPLSDAQLKEMVFTEQMLPDEVYVDMADLARRLGLTHAEPEKAAPPGAPAAEKKAPVAEGGKAGELKPLLIYRPLADDARVKVRSFSAQEPFSIYMKASLVAGAILASPWIFYQIWQFVAAGLYPHERRYVYVFFPFSLALFLSGVALVFFVVFGRVLAFLLSFNAWMGIEPELRLSEWMGFVLILPLGFGLGFQLPLVMLFLERVGILTIKTYLSHWRVSILALAIIAMILTPPDPYSMMLMFLPLGGLYFGGILLCKIMPRRKSAYNVEYGDE